MFSTEISRLTVLTFLILYLALLSNDIALVKLSEPAKMSQYVSVMGLNDVKDLDENLHCEIGGWGQIQSGKNYFFFFSALNIQFAPLCTRHLIHNMHCLQISLFFFPFFSSLFLLLQCVHRKCDNYTSQYVRKV